MRKKLICSLTEENLAKKESIGHPKRINYQQGKCVKILFWGENEKGVPSVLHNISKNIQVIELLFYTNVDK